MPLNIEIKARSNNHEKIKTILKEKNASFKGIDHQIDTYFKVSNGRMKLREGNIENNLIFYQRSDQAGPKRSDVALYKSTPDSELKNVLSLALGVFKVVDKQRGIYYVENVKFHLDEVKGLGTFVEIEAIDTDGSLSQEALLKQCEYYMNLFEIKETDLIEVSYSDLI